jgi:hypothetical protein
MAKRIAALCTAYFPYSHADVIVTRWLDPHPHDAVVGFRPRSHIASLYVMQFPEGDIPIDFRVRPAERDEKFDPGCDISRLVAKTYGVPMFNSIREALTLGGDTLAVDAVQLIGEHGTFPLTAHGQIAYPRKAMWDEVVSVFRESGRVVPVFFDKHLATDMDDARAIVDTARTMGIPLFAGSSVPILGPKNPHGLPTSRDMVESLGLFYVGPEVYGIHSLEFVQSLIERRIGGEPGIRALTVYQGDAVWQAMANGAWSQPLFEATLAAMPLKKRGDMQANLDQPPVAFVAEHVDGHRQTHVMLAGHVTGFAAGLRVRDDPTLYVTYNDTSDERVFVINFASICREMDRFFETGVSPTPIERCLLTTLHIATAMRQLTECPGVRVETPWLEIPYAYL